MLSERWLRMSQAILHISESLDLETVLQDLSRSARTLMGAKYSAILLYDSCGRIVDFVTCGFTADPSGRHGKLEDRMTFLEHLRCRAEPLRIPDFRSYAKSAGFPDFRPPVEYSGPLPVLVVPIFYRDKRLGEIYLGGKEAEQDSEGREKAFTLADEETLVLFATQASPVIANARRHRKEQQARADLETLVNTVPVGVLVFDSGTRELVLSNGEATRIFADLFLSCESAHKLLDRATFRNLSGQEVPPDMLPCQRVFRTGEAVQAEELMVEAPNGRSVNVMFNAAPICNDRGRMEAVVLTMQDMTPLADLERLRAEFLVMVSHELRSPLAGIKGSAVTLLEDISSLGSAEMVQYFQIIIEQADYMRELVSDLIDVVQIETGSLSISPAPVDVARVVDEARIGFLSGGGRDNIRIDIEADLPPALADKRRLIQVINNLLTNAANNSHESSVIRIDAVTQGVHVAVSVTDTGRGITADRLPHLFEKYSGLGNNEPGRHLGLGLAICKGIVEAHGGRISAESDGLGLGSRFMFTIPAAEKPVPTAAGGPQEAQMRMRWADSDPIRVLAVDDDPRMLKQIRDVLGQAGCDHMVTGDPEEVASLMRAFDPHVVLLDQMLPGTDGIELMRELLAVKNVPVIFLSAYGQVELVARTFAMGAADYIVKPFSPTELVARVYAALRKQSQLGGAQQLNSYVSGNLVVDYTARSVTLEGCQVELTPTEYSLLVELSANAGKPVGYEQLMRRVWGPDRTDDIRPLRTVVKTLRRKLGDTAADPRFLFTAHRVGYRMPAPDAAGESRPPA